MGPKTVLLWADYVVDLNCFAQLLSQNLCQQLRYTTDECDGSIIIYIGLRWFLEDESDVALLPGGWGKTRYQNVVVHGQERGTGDRTSILQHKS